MDLPVELKSPRKGLINIKNKDEKCFLWCHVRHINPSKEHPERIKKTDKKVTEKLDYDGIEFPVQEKDFNKIEVKNSICINVFGYKNGLVFPIYVSDSIDFLLLTNLSRILTDLCFTKKSCLQCFSSERLLIKHKEICLSINGKQSVRLEK